MQRGQQMTAACLLVRLAVVETKLPDQSHSAHLESGVRRKAPEPFGRGKDCKVLSILILLGMDLKDLLKLSMSGRFRPAAARPLSEPSPLHRQSWRRWHPSLQASRAPREKWCWRRIGL